MAWESQCREDRQGKWGIWAGGARELGWGAGETALGNWAVGDGRSGGAGLEKQMSWAGEHGGRS